MDNEPKDQRVVVMMTASEVKALDTWGFARHIRSRADVVRRLLKAALDAGIEPPPKDGKAPPRE